MSTSHLNIPILLVFNTLPIDRQYIILFVYLSKMQLWA